MNLTIGGAIAGDCEQPAIPQRLQPCAKAKLLLESILRDTSGRASVRNPVGRTVQMDTFKTPFS
jgi:hypothetical protein